jgi:hypothetical protein
MSKITVHGALIRAILKTLVFASDADRGSRLTNALETLSTEIDQWAVSGDGLNMLVDNDNDNLTVSDELVRAAMLVAARRFEAPLGTALRRSLEQLAIELDSWAVTGSLEKQQRKRRTSCICLRDVKVKRKDCR